VEVKQPVGDTIEVDLGRGRRRQSADAARDRRSSDPEHVTRVLGAAGADGTFAGSARARPKMFLTLIVSE
jgi:hypothetical protein